MSVSSYPDVQDKDSIYYALWRPEVCIASIVAYLGLIKLLIVVMEKREPLGLKGPMALYNLAQVLLCSYMCYGLCANPLSNFFRLNIKYDQATEYFVFVHYISKWLDYLDTVFMALRKKSVQISVLHVFHHASIPLIWSILLYTRNAYGTVSLGAFANSFIHVMMYSHYLVTAFGINNPFKKLITKLQLVQFTTLIMHSIAAALFEKEIENYLTYVQLAYQTTMLLMFGSFYQKSYKKGSKVDTKDDTKKVSAKRSKKVE